MACSQLAEWTGILEKTTILGVLVWFVWLLYLYLFGVYLHYLVVYLSFSLGANNVSLFVYTECFGKYNNLDRCKLNIIRKTRIGHNYTKP